MTIETSGDAEEIVELLGQVHEEHRHRRPQWFKPFDRTAALEGQRNLLSRAGAQMFVARAEGVCVGYALVCERVREENAFRYASRSLVVDQMAVSNTHRRKGIGTLLMDRIRAEAAKRGVERVELSVYSDNDEACRFYPAYSRRSGEKVGASADL
ncbi:MAG: GNAT family N-acetyltransferase, partial [Spirochaetaceae bacterium]|nr:GNAT family N-acetyltransferase [Spirochaetaceae bacterium]